MSEILAIGSAATDPADALRRVLERISARAGTAPSMVPFDCGGTQPSDFDALIEEAAQRAGLDPSLVRAVVAVESGFRPNAVSRAGAKGLMQLMDGTARALGVSNPFDPAQNLWGGTAFLRQMLGRFRDERLALAAYNAGPAAVERFGGIPPYAETRRYVSLVMAERERIRAWKG